MWSNIYLNKVGFFFNFIENFTHQTIVELVFVLFWVHT